MQRVTIDSAVKTAAKFIDLQLRPAKSSTPRGDVASACSTIDRLPSEAFKSQPLESQSAHFTPACLVDFLFFDITS